MNEMEGIFFYVLLMMNSFVFVPSRERERERERVVYVIPRWAQIDYGLAERNLDNCIKGLAIKRERESSAHTTL